MTARQVKQAANEEYAERFPHRDKAARKQARRARTERCEWRWLEAMGIPRDKTRPLCA